MNLSFIIIDDSELDCFVARKIIEHTDKSLPVKTFLNGHEVINQMPADFDRHDTPITIILLDLRMPIMNGFQFVDEFEKLPLVIKRKYRVHILSSTKNANDIYRILKYDSVLSMIEKPFTREKSNTLLTKIKAEE